MANPFVHIELHTTEIAKARAFYGELFDWELQDVPMGDFTYTTIGVGEGGVGGGMMPNTVPPAWLPYVAVDDVAAATKKAVELGGRVITDVTPIGGAGTFSIVADPTGATFGLWKGNG
ncbi:MAG: VOC family protein [Candidatus Eremiobacteraeota bacterium]|nr:VOC family protein [Candidatus Eremiobacteraeota bacterium]